MNPGISKNLSSINFDKILHRVFFILPFGVLGNLLFVYYTSDNRLIPHLSHFSLIYFIISLFLCIFPWFTHTLRLAIWTRFLKRSISFVNLFKIAIGTDLGSSISPTAMGGGYLKVGMLMQQGLTPGEALSLMFLGSVEDYIFILTFMPAAFIITKSWNHPLVKRLFDNSAAPIFFICSILVIVIFLILFGTKRLILNRISDRF